jgi:hypothetical protein
MIRLQRLRANEDATCPLFRNGSLTASLTAGERGSAVVLEGNPGGLLDCS